MRLKILLPAKVFLERGGVAKIVAEAENGSFGLLPRHVDCVAPLAPGILCFEDAEGAEEFVALDGGALVKQGASVSIATRRAIRGPELEGLRRAVEDEFLRLDERERKTRTALARLETEFARRFLATEET